MPHQPSPAKLLEKEWSAMRDALIESKVIRNEPELIHLARMMFFRGARVATAEAMKHPLVAVLLAAEINAVESVLREMIEESRTLQ